MPKFKVGDKVGFNKKTGNQGYTIGIILEISNIHASDDLAYRVARHDRQWGVLWYSESSLHLFIDPNDILKALVCLNSK